MLIKVESDKSKVKNFALCFFTFARFFVFCLLLPVFCFGADRVPFAGPRTDSGDIAANQPRQDKLFSPSTGQKFYEIAYELANTKDITAPQRSQAIVFLTATMDLDETSRYFMPDMIKLVSRYPQANNSRLMSVLLMYYVNEFADLEVISAGVRYMLEQMNSREEREKFLDDTLKTLGGKNIGMDSEMDTLLGLLNVEKSDFNSAQRWFMQAYDKNKYNTLAFEKLMELMPGQISPAMYLEHLRLELRKDPFNLERSLAFAEYAERLQLYDTAVDTYKYCSDLFDYLYPSQPLPSRIYLPWAISSYNTQRNQQKCLQIAESIRQSGRFDLILEAIAGKAAAKIGGDEQANQILRAAEEKMLKTAGYKPQAVDCRQLAWFYCFVQPDENKALQWANKAYSIESNSVTAAALLAYSLVMNDQNDLAKTLIDNNDSSQIATLAKARIQLAQGQKGPAVEILKSAIARDAGSLEAEQAKELLTQNGGEYVPPIDPDIILTTLKNSFGQAIVPSFISPEKMIALQLNVRGSKFAYGGKFGGTVAIINNSPEPIVVCDEGLFMGYIRIDAVVSGDINKKIPNVVFTKVKPPLPIEPGRSLIIPVQLDTGELRQILIAYPQASLNIEFTAFVDPVISDQNVPLNRLSGIKPATAVVTRPGVELTEKFLQNRFNSFTKGRQGQKITTLELFSGLLMEQHAMANREPLYKFVYADWMPTLLKSILVKGLTEDDWVVKVYAMAGALSLPMDYELTNAAAENLTDTHWPARLMALYLLSKSQGSNFSNVLDHTAKYDQNTLVRDMAVALGGVRPRISEPNQPAVNEPNRPQPGKSGTPEPFLPGGPEIRKPAAKPMPTPKLSEKRQPADSNGQ